MKGISERLGRGWSGAGTATRLWWSGVASVAMAGALLIGGVAVAGAVNAPVHTSEASPGGSPATGSPAMRSGAAGSGSTGAMAAPASGGHAICPNVRGATVMADGMVMAPVPSSSPTPAQQAAATHLVTAVDQGIAPYADVRTAEADGYEPISARRGPMTHYLDRSVVEHGDVLDPSHPSALMFANTVDGPVLIGAMFLGPAPCVPGPDIGGSLTQWHAHDNLCFSGGRLVGKAAGDGTCTTGSRRNTSYFMLHVWTAPQLAAQYQFQADLPPSAYAAIDAGGQP